MLRDRKKAVLLLQDGTKLQGYAFGKIGTTTGEICFNTGMTGYQEVFTDPSYFGQIIIMNNVHIGNYGSLSTDVESASVKVKGIIARNMEEKFSRFMAEGSLQDYLEKEGITGITGVDTRALVEHVRTKGAMNCIISSEEFDDDKLNQALAAVPNMDGLELATAVSTKEPYTIGDEAAGIRIAVLDCGVKKNILTCLAERGAYLKVFNAHTSFEEMEAFKPTGYFISNGPGDPSPLHFVIATIKKILAADKPLFGICLGHQLLALSNGVGTFKMHHGHRGLNHPVKNLQTGKSEITTQNHGFGVKPDDIAKNENVEITHINLNDNSIEGIRIRNKKAFSVQYHPEATPGPNDSRYLFDDFINLMK